MKNRTLTLVLAAFALVTPSSAQTTKYLFPKQINTSGTITFDTDLLTNSPGILGISAGTITSSSAGSTDNIILRSDGTGGGLLQSSVATLSDTGLLTVPGGLITHAGNTQGVVIGQMGGNATTNASDSVRIGFGANESATTASTSSIFIGRHAGSHGIGSNSVFLGHAPGQYAIDSANSVLIGYLTARNASQNASYHGFSMVAIGHEAATNGINNQTSVTIGAQAGKASTNAVGSVKVGFSSGTNSTTSTGSTMLGQYTGYNATTATGAVLIGSEAGYGLTDATSRLIIESNTSFRDVGLIAGNFATGERSVALNTSKLGFYGASPATKPEITGTRADGAALADLLSSLATLGLVTDSSTAGDAPTGGGKLVQTKLYVSTAIDQAVASLTPTSVMTGTITPTSTSNTIFVLVVPSIGCSHTGWGGITRISRGGTGISVGASAGSRRRSGSAWHSSSTAYFSAGGTTAAYETAPSTSSLTYSFDIATNNAVVTGYLNRTGTDPDTADGARGATVMFIAEIAP